MVWKCRTATRYCLLLLALALHGEAARQQGNMLDLDEESTATKLRFEADSPARGRFQFRYDGPPSSHSPSTPEPAAVVEDAQVLPEVDPQDHSDCGPLGRHKYRCVPPMKTTTKTTAPQEVAAEHDAQVLPENSSDCGPLGQHKYRCVPPMKTLIKTPAPDEVSPVAPSVQEARHPAHPAHSACGPLSKDKYRCVPPMP